MSASVVSFLFSIAAATWIYTKFQRYSGNNTKSSAIAAGICFLLIFIIFEFAFKAITK